MRRYRVLTLVNESLVPPESTEGFSDKEIDEWKTEYDVVTTLRESGHTVEVVGVSDNLQPIREAIDRFRPHITFNLLEEFHGVVTYDHAIVSYLELLRMPYTGCNPRGMMISKDKALSKKILAFHRIPSPHFTVFPPGRKVKRPKRLRFPLFVKSVVEDASLAISQASVVWNDAELAERVAFVHEQTNAGAIAEEYIEGREFYVGVIGNQRTRTFPIWELKFTRSDAPLIATRRVKWDRAYQQKLGVVTEPAGGLTEQQQQKIARMCKKVYKVLELSGYARMDLRMNAAGRVYVLEANPNPNLSYGEDFAESAHAAGVPYEELLDKIINLGLRYRAPWKR